VGKEEVGREDVRTARGRFLYTGGHDAGGVYKTAYRETIPKTAKLTTTGNSQVLALQCITTITTVAYSEQ
jgi:hypothetical protein